MREHPGIVGPVRAYLTITRVDGQRVRFTDMGDGVMTTSRDAMLVAMRYG